MGTWSAGSFGNDCALDFAFRLNGTPDLASAIEVLGPKTNWIDSDLASEAIAAADIIAALLGRASTDLPDEFPGILKSYESPSSALVASASKAVEHVRSNSELAELWAESEDDDWTRVLDDLVERLDLSKTYLVPVNGILETDDSIVGSIGLSCEFCGDDVVEPEGIMLVVESDDDDIVWFRSTTYAHRGCIKQHLKPPHFNADGTPHPEVLSQLRKRLTGS